MSLLDLLVLAACVCVFGDRNSPDYTMILDDDNVDVDDETNSDRLSA